MFFTNPHQKATIIVGFPGIGKSHVYENKNEYAPLKVYDEPGYDNSDKEELYLEFQRLANQNCIILSPAHPQVCRYLIEQGLYFYSVYPSRNSKQEYLTRYRNRKYAKNKGDSKKDRITGEEFAKVANEKWDQWLDTMHYESEHPSMVTQVHIKRGQTLRHVLPEILGKDAVRNETLSL